MDDVGSGAGSRDADDSVIRSDVMFLQFFPSAHGIVFGVFHGIAQGAVASGNQADDTSGGHAECGWDFRCVEHTQPAAGTRTDVEEASAALHTLDDGRYQTLYLRDALPYGQSHLLVFLVDALQQFTHRLLFQMVVQGRLFRYLYKCHIANLCGQI